MTLKINKNLLLPLLVALACCACPSSAFAPTAFQPARMVVAARPHHHHRAVSAAASALTLRAAGDDEAGEGEASKTKPAPTSGTFYDDEVDPIPAQKKGISDSMRERLIREANTGLDSDTKQTNVLLYIIIGVAVLVILGGEGIFY